MRNNTLFIRPFETGTVILLMTKAKINKNKSSRTSNNSILGSSAEKYKTTEPFTKKRTIITAWMVTKMLFKPSFSLGSKRRTQSISVKMMT